MLEYSSKLRNRSFLPLINIHIFAIMPSFQFIKGEQHKKVTLVSGPSQTPVTIHIIRDLLARSYLIQTPKGLYLIDTGMPGNAQNILKVMQSIGREDLKCIFITHAHFEHYGGAKRLKEQTQAPILIHKDDAGFLQRGQTPVKNVKGIGYLGKGLLPLAEWLWPPPKINPDVIIKDGFRLNAFGLDAVVIHTPGHTPGSCCLLLGGAYLFAGDLMTTKIQKLYADNWDDLRESYRRVMALKPKIIFTGHSRVLQ